MLRNWLSGDEPPEPEPECACLWCGKPIEADQMPHCSSKCRTEQYTVEVDAWVSKFEAERTDAQAVLAKVEGK